MHFNALILALVPSVSALGVRRSGETGTGVLKRQDVDAVTDQLLFDDTLPEFITARNAEDPPYLDWSSDGCSDSPDNPLGFPFEPACYRHDFGYRNYKEQDRFTDSNRLKIDNNFKSDLYYQCAPETFKDVCDALADVYYEAVRLFGGTGETPGRRTDEAEENHARAYEEKLDRYNQLVKMALAEGLLATQ